MNDENMKICECECDECQDSEYDYDYDYDKECYPRPPKRIRPNRSLLKCGNLGAVTIPEATAVGANYTLTSITVDTKYLKKPNIKFEFSSNIVTTAGIAAPTIALNFQLFKQCKNMIAPIPVGSIWIFARNAQVTSDTFSFFICDCDFCHDDCCTYSVNATVSGGVGGLTAGITSINNASLAAIVIEDSQCC